MRTLESIGEGTTGRKPGAEKTGCRDLRVAQAPEQMSRGERGNQNLKSSTPMTARNLKTLVTEAVTLDREINEKAERLKVIKAKLVELLPAEGGGTRWTAEGHDGCVARVNFPAPSLKAKIDGEGKAIEKIKKLAGAVFSKLFVPTISFKPVADFRAEATALLARAEANKLIKLCQSDTTPRVSFETADRTAAVA